MVSTTTINNRRQWDVVVVGAGHAGCEAALAAARAGCRVLVLTPNVDRVGFMPCNPSIGGPGKSHIVAEVDALGGEMARAADRTALQVRELNTSKGPAVRAVRIQADKQLYALSMKETLESSPNVTLVQDDAVALMLNPGETGVRGVRARLLGDIDAVAVVVTAGTFLRAAMIAGSGRHSGGRAGDRADQDLSASLSGVGLKLRRLKTGTPPRIDARTVDLGACESQPGSPHGLWLSRDGRKGRIEPIALPPISAHQPHLSGGWRPQLACFKISTNATAHELISANLHRAPMFNGSIEGVGPRYCPSIEDKVARFGDKDAHPIFLEPEGWRTTELYMQGMSTSLPPDVQDAVIHAIPALRDARITRYGYAVEYDALDPSELRHTLESRRVDGLFFAGQVNGTSGYEEAAGQGVLAGINAAARVSGDEPLILRRDQSYIGVMVDDLVSKPFDEPYRMLTSRAEFRLTLRPNTADARLAEIGHAYGVVPLERVQEVESEIETLARASEWLERQTVRVVDEVTGVTIRRAPLAELLRRPGTSIEDVVAIAAREHAGVEQQLPAEMRPAIEESVKYAAFVDRERREVERRSALDHRPLPAELDVETIPGLRYEAGVKLRAHRPRTIGEASRLAGVTPSDIAALLIHTSALQLEAAQA